MRDRNRAQPRRVAERGVFRPEPLLQPEPRDPASESWVRRPIRGSASPARRPRSRHRGKRESRTGIGSAWAGRCRSGSTQFCGRLTDSSEPIRSPLAPSWRTVVDMEPPLEPPNDPPLEPPNEPPYEPTYEPPYERAYAGSRFEPPNDDLLLSLTWPPGVSTSSPRDVRPPAADPPRRSRRGLVAAGARRSSHCRWAGALGGWLTSDTTSASSAPAVKAQAASLAVERRDDERRGRAPRRTVGRVHRDRDHPASGPVHTAGHRRGFRHRRQQRRHDPDQRARHRRCDIHHGDGCRRDQGSHRDGHHLRPRA